MGSTVTQMVMSSVTILPQQESAKTCHKMDRTQSNNLVFRISIIEAYFLPNDPLAVLVHHLCHIMSRNIRGIEIILRGMLHSVNMGVKMAIGKVVDIKGIKRKNLHHQYTSNYFCSRYHDYVTRQLRSRSISSLKSKQQRRRCGAIDLNKVLVVDIEKISSRYPGDEESEHESLILISFFQVKSNSCMYSAPTSFQGPREEEYVRGYYTPWVNKMILRKGSSMMVCFQIRITDVTKKLSNF